MRDHLQKWDDEKTDTRNQTVYNRIFDEIMEDLDEEYIDDFDRSLAMFSLMNLEEVYKRVVDADWDIDEETLYDVINQYMVQMSWGSSPIIHDDILPHEKLMFVPKKPSSVGKVKKYATKREHRDQPSGFDMIYMTIVM
jgi:hypothetical protein